MANQTRCLLCGGTAIIKHNSFPGYQEPDTFQIYNCTDCDTSFSLPDADTSELYENIYKNGNKVPGYNRYWRYIRFIRKFSDPLGYLSETSEAYWAIKSALKEYDSKKDQVKVLEIGSGLGYLTYSLAKNGYDIKGLDISKTAVEKATELFGNNYIRADLSEFETLNAGLYDIVILTEVIEHIKEPLQFIKSINNLLKPGGVAVITTPNKSIYPSHMVWVTDLPPVHCWWFSEASMEYIAKELGMKVTFINFGEFYKENYKVIGIKSPGKEFLPKPNFNSKGELIKNAAINKSDFKSYLKLYFSKTIISAYIYKKVQQYIKIVFGKSREIITKDIIVCKEKGSILCAVMKKPSL